MTKLKTLNDRDMITLSGNFSTMQGFIDAVTSGVSSLASRMTTVESAASTNASAISALASRVTTAESTISSHSSSISSLNTDVTSLKAWRAAKATASPDVSTVVSVATAVITLGLNCPTAAGINTLFATVMTEVNGLKAILRSREILAT